MSSEYIVSAPCEIILSSNIRIAPFGAPVGVNSVSASACPESPTTSAPGPWVSIGRVRNAKIQTEYKSSDNEGADEDGRYSVKEMRVATKRKLQFQCGDVSKEALRLTFGLLTDVTSSTEVTPFAMSSEEIDCWLYGRVSDAYRDGTDMAEFRVPGKLRLTNPVNMASDPVACDWELLIDARNPLRKFKALGIKSMG